MSKPAVLNVCFSRAWGGLEMSSVKMTRLFHQAGYESFEVCPPDSAIEKALKEQNLSHWALENKDYVSLGTTWAIRRLIQERQIKAVFLHSMRDIWLVTPALWGLRDVRLYGFARMFFKDVNKKDFGHTLMYSRLSKMIALSEIQKRYLTHCLPVSEDRFIVIPNGVDTDRFQPRPKREDIRASWGIDPEHLLFGLIGRLDRQKGSLEFVEAAAEVLKIHPHARFVLVGGNTIDGHGREFDQEVARRLQELNLPPQTVILTDFRKDIPEVLNALDVFVMPSYEENFANVMLEALASGVPSIGTDSGGTPEILDHGRTGLLCEPRSSRSLAQAMDKLIRDPRLRSDLATAARFKALTEYDMKKVFTRIEALVTN